MISVKQTQFYHEKYLSIHNNTYLINYNVYALNEPISTYIIALWTLWRYNMNINYVCVHIKVILSYYKCRLYVLCLLELYPAFDLEPNILFT